MRIIRNLKFKFSESYRISIGCGLSAIRNDRERKALVTFCENELKDEESMKLNPDRKAVYETTLKLDKLETPKGFWFKTPHSGTKKIYYNSLDDFVENHVGWYWN